MNMFPAKRRMKASDNRYVKIFSSSDSFVLEAVVESSVVFSNLFSGIQTGRNQSSITLDLLRQIKKNPMYKFTHFFR